MRNLWFCSNFGNLKVGTLVFLKLRVMEPSRPISNLSASTSCNSTMKYVYKRSKKSPGISIIQRSEEAVVKENDMERKSGEFQSFAHDAAELEAMTVQELRTRLRSIGLPAKGRKSELLSALKCCKDNQINGESSHVAGQQVNISLKRKAKNSSREDDVQNATSLSEVSEVQRSKRRVEKLSADNNVCEVSTEVLTTKQKLSIEPGVEPWTVLAHKKPQKGWVPYIPRMMRPPPLSGDTKYTKLMSWNVNGLRALLKLEGFSALELAQREEFDVLCLQETKLQEKDVEAIKQCLLDGYDNSFWTCSVSKLGYSGTAIISRVKPLSVRYGLGIRDHDGEGRLVTVEFDKFYLLSAYVPNSGDGLKRLSYRITQWDPSLGRYMKELEKSKPVVLTGDLNCAHQEIDIYNPAGNKRSAGFTIEERESFETNFLSNGFVDTFRKQHPGVVGYTYWGYRHGGRKTNKGWRLDYFLVSESIADKVHDSYILPDVGGSDHSPIGLILKL